MLQGRFRSSVAVLLLQHRSASSQASEAFLSQASDSSHPLIRGISKLLSQPSEQFASPDIQKFYKRKNNPAFLCFKRLRRLRRRQPEEMKPNQYLFLMTQWAKKAGPKIGQSMFEQMLKVGVEPVNAYSTMIRHFMIRARGESEEPSDARLLPSDDSLLSKGAAEAENKDNCVLEALKYLHEMREKGITPNGDTYEPLLLWFLENNKKAEFQELLEWLTRDGLTCYTGLFRALGTLGMHEEACGYFTSLKDIDDSEELRFKYLGAYVRGVASKHTANETLKRFKHVVEKLNVKPDVDPYITIAYRCCKEGQIHQALDIVQDANMRGVELSPELFQPLLFVFRDGMQPRAALELFAAMRRMGVTPSYETFSCLIRVCSKTNDVEKLLNLLAEMKELGIKRTAEIYTSIIQALGRTKQFLRALDMLRDMEKDNLQPDSFTYSELIAACPDHKVALELVKRMKIHGITVTDGVLSNLFMTMKKCGELDKAIEMLQESDACRIGITAKSTLLCGLASARRLDEAFACFEDIRKEGKLPEPYALGCLIEAVGYAGDLDRMLELFDLSLSHSVWRRKDEHYVEEQQIRYCLYITKACILHNDLRRLEDFLRKADYLTGTSMFDTVILSIEEGGGDFKSDWLNFSWSDGFSLLELMHKLNFPVSRTFLESLLEGCIKLRDAGRADSILKEMERNGLQQNVFTYIRLLRLYVALEDIAKAALVLDKMKHNLKDEDIFLLTGEVLNAARPDMQKKIFKLLDARRSKVEKD